MKIVYSGLQRENYNPQRGLSFEYRNFYETFKKMTGVEVIEFPFDQIVLLGKRAFNKELLELVRKEKPDIFFAFMYSDEFDQATLKEIKGLTTSIAWFADDSWRFYNYTRHWLPYFTWAVTTYSWMPALYQKLGFYNVIRSQWGCNPNQWWPVQSESGQAVERDLDVSFVGQHNPDRSRVVQALRLAGLPVWVRGWGWPEGKLSQDEMISIFSRSKINLNINSQSSLFTLKSFARIFFCRSRLDVVPDWHFVSNLQSWLHISVPQIKARPFELATCKSFVISGYADDLNNFFEEDKEMVFYRTTDELIEKIRYYLPRSEERKAIAEAGYQRVLRDHTYEQRFRDIFNRVGIL